MLAWTRSGNSVEHPAPWGRHGTFSTLRTYQNGRILFKKDHFQRLITSAEYLNLVWIPNIEEINSYLEKYLSQTSIEEDSLLRVCLFEDCIAFSSRPAKSDGNPVEGWLLNYRRPEPSIKSTAEADLYGALQELEVEREDWVIIDPKDNEIRETATSNLIFVRDEELIIPEKKILAGVTLQKLIPSLKENFSVTRRIPTDQEIGDFDEILLCGTGRGVAPMKSLPELGWSSKRDLIFSQVRTLYQQMIENANDRI